MAIDTIFLCFCEDSDRNDGVKRPYYMSAGLKKFLDDSDRALKEEQAKKEGKETGGGGSTVSVKPAPTKDISDVD